MIQKSCAASGPAARTKAVAAERLMTVRLGVDRDGLWTSTIVPRILPSLKGAYSTRWFECRRGLLGSFS
jgi:hypothetical protein